MELKLKEYRTLHPPKMREIEIVAGLLAKRSKMFNEAECVRDRMANIKNEVAALEGNVEAPGDTVGLHSIIPRQK